MSSKDIVINEEVRNYVIEKTQEQGYFSKEDITTNFQDFEEVLSDLKNSEEYKVVSINKQDVYLHKSLTLNRFKELPNNVKDKLVEEGYSKRTTSNCNALDVLENVGVNGIPKTLEGRINNPVFVDVVKYVNETLKKYK